MYSESPITPTCKAGIQWPHPWFSRSAFWAGSLLVWVGSGCKEKSTGGLNLVVMADSGVSDDSNPDLDSAAPLDSGGSNDSDSGADSGASSEVFSVGIDPVEPTTFDDLAVVVSGFDGTWSASWTVDDRTMGEASSTVEASLTARGDGWRVVVLTDDGQEASASITIADGGQPQGPALEPTVVADGETDDTAAIQAAIDELAAKDGGRVVLRAGDHRVTALEVYDGVRLVGTGAEYTTLRGLDTSYAEVSLTGTGAGLMDVTIYGSDVDATGDDWLVSKGLPAYNIVVVDAIDAHIADVRSLESRYDTLYVHGSTGLYVEGGRFNRAGRNTMSMVGNDSDFTVEGAHFGPLFGLYLVDLEPWDEQYVQNGTFTGCTFDAVGSGDFPGTSHWGRFLALVAADDQSHDLRLESCTFDKAYVRPVGTWVGLEVDDCSFEMNGDFAFVDADYPSYPVLQDATIENSVFMDYGKPSTDVVYGVSFTGECSWSGNDPSELDDGRECDTED